MQFLKNGNFDEKHPLYYNMKDGYYPPYIYDGYYPAYYGGQHPSYYSGYYPSYMVDNI